MATHTIKIKDENSGHYEKGWEITNYEPTEKFLKQNGATGSENTIWQKGTQYAIGTVDGWGNQCGVALVFHKSHLD